MHGRVAGFACDQPQRIGVVHARAPTVNGIRPDEFPLALTALLGEVLLVLRPLGGVKAGFPFLVPFFYLNLHKYDKVTQYHSILLLNNYARMCFSSSNTLGLDTIILFPLIHSRTEESFSFV